VRAGLEVLRSLSGASPGLVLSDMASSANKLRTAHAHIGSYARDCGVKRLFAWDLRARARWRPSAGGEWFADAECLTRRLRLSFESA